ncbi:MAG: rod shape-determining protein MreD [Acidaminococcaceae bacterium]
MSFLIWPVFLLLLLSLQTSWFVLFPGNNFTPDFLLLFVVFHAMFSGSNKGTIFGAAVGLVQDVLAPTTFGFHIVTRALVGFFIGETKERVFKDNAQGYCVFVAAASLFVKVTHFVLMMVIAGSAAGWFLDYVWETICYMLLNVLVSLPMWFVLQKIGRWLDKRNSY